MENKEERAPRIRRKCREARSLITWPDGRARTAGFFWKSKVLPDRRSNNERRKTISGTIEDRAPQ